MSSVSSFLPAIVVATLAYLVGSVSAAIVTCRLMGLDDPRSAGSGNPGATNVLRVGGKKAAAFTLLGDALKGLLPVLAAGLLGAAPAVVALAAVAAFVGHLYPVFFDFRGGKGVATALGALLGLNLTAGLLAVLLWLAVALAFKRSSLAALISFALVPVLLLMEGERTGAAAFTMVALGLLYTHRGNVQRLLAGSEPLIGKR